jgi:hypothetical protein
MKSTKKYLSLGVALAIALFASVQITAMAPKVNPYLSDWDKEVLQNRIAFEGRFLDPNSAYFRTDERFRNSSRATIKQLEEIYYGNRPYTSAEMYRAEHGM